MGSGEVRVFDVSHDVEDGMVTYPGLPAPVVCDFWSREGSAHHYEEGTTFQIGKIEMVANTGTYVDAPFHRFEDGADLSELGLERLAHVPGLVVRVMGASTRAIGAEWFQGLELRGRAVLVHTGWSRLWGTPAYFEGHPFLTQDAATWLRDQGVQIVGIDSLNIDDTRGGGRPVHTTLLGAGVPIVEHLCGLESLPDDGFWFHAAPVKVRGMGTFPVRAYGVVEVESSG